MIRALSRPPHLLGFVHPPIDQRVGRAFGHRSSNAQTCTIPFGIIDEPRALATEIVVNLMQRMPQLAGWHTLRAMAAFAREDMHDLADPLERELGVPGPAVPNSPLQALDLCDDHCLGSGPTRLVS